MGSRAALRQVAKRSCSTTRCRSRARRRGEARLAVNKELISLPRGARIAARSPPTLVYALESGELEDRAGARRPRRASCPRASGSRASRVDPREIAIAGARSAVRSVREARHRSHRPLGPARDDHAREPGDARLSRTSGARMPPPRRSGSGSKSEPMPVTGSGRLRPGGGTEWRQRASSSVRTGSAGRANVHPMTGEVMLQLGRALARGVPPVAARRPCAARADRQGHPPLRLHARGRARRGAVLDGRERAAGRADPDAGPRVPDGRHALRRRRDDHRLAQPVRGQRGQVLLARRLQAARRGRGADRGAPRLARARDPRARSARTSAARAGSTTRRAVTSSSSRRPSRASARSRGCASRSIARTAPPTRSRPPCSRSSART